MLKTKRIITVILICCLSLSLAGCGITIKTDSLTKYINTTDTNGMLSSLTNKLSISYSQLETIKTTFKDLHITPKDSTTFFDFDSYITPMQTDINNISNIKLIEGGTVTTNGEQFLQAFYIDSENFSYVREACCQAIIEQIRNAVRGTSLTTQNIDFINSYSTSSISDVDSFLSLFGYKVKSIKIHLPHINDKTKVTTGLDAEDFQLYMVDISNGKSKNLPKGISDGNSGTVKSISFKQEPYPNKDSATHYALKLTNLASNTNAEWSNLHLPAYINDTDAYRETNFHLVSADAGLTSTEFEERISEYKTDTNTYSDAIQQWIEKDVARNYRTYVMHVANCIEVVEHNEALNYCISNAFYNNNKATPDEYLKSKATYTYYEPIANIYSYNVNNSATSAYSAILNGRTNQLIGVAYIGIELEYMYEDDSIEYIDIRRMGTTSDKTAASTYNAYDITKNAPYSLDYLADVIMKLKDAQLVVLNKDLLNAGVSKVDILSRPISDTSVFTIATDAKNNKIKINLFEHLDKDKLTKEDLTEVQAIELAIGNMPLGNFYLRTLSSKIAPSDTVMTLNENGTIQESNVIQRFKFYSTSSTDIYCLFGLYDVGVLECFKAEKNETLDFFSYAPLLGTNGLTYNIFGDCLYQAGQDNGKAVMFDSEGSVRLYNSDDISYTTVDQVTNYYSSKFISNENNSLDNVIKYVSNSKSPFVLRTYLEGLFLPDYYNSEPFICLGRKLVFSNTLFDATKIVTENTPAFTVLNPTDSLIDATTTYHTVLELLDSDIKSKVVDDMTYKGIARLKNSTQDDILRTNLASNTLATNLTTVNTLVYDYIYSGEFKTRTTGNYSRANRFAQAEKGVQEKKGIVTPRLFVWCTAASVDADLGTYINSHQFSAWQIWLNSNGYENYLGDMSSDDLKTELVSKIEQTFNIDLNATTQGKDIIIDTDGLDQLDDWINQRAEQKKNAIIDIVLRIIAIMLLVYGLLLLICYIIDVAVAGEGEGVLKKVTFNRMMTVTGLTKEERQSLSQKNEKGTYTTRAVSIADLIPVILIIWAVATIIIIGSTYNIVGTFIKLAEQITQIIRSAIGKE